MSKFQYIGQQVRTGTYCFHANFLLGLVRL